MPAKKVSKKNNDEFTRYPYIGLEPYREEDKEFFFGRKSDQSIIIDKVLTNKLTLLCATSGTGKTSLIQASIIPKLKSNDFEHLDVACIRQWMTEPIEHIKDIVLTKLKSNHRMNESFYPDSNISLQKFLRICSMFTIEPPYVIILDQFEEFFQYQQYNYSFENKIKQLSEAINDNEAPVNFLISMREDFIMELNWFENYLDRNPFRNYHRLERFNIKQAEEVITKPVEKLKFKYESELLKNLIKDLAEKEKEAKLGKSSFLNAQNSSFYIEPTYLQIVCKGLWEISQSNKDKTIKIDAYIEKNRTEGFVNSYFVKVMSHFTDGEQKIISQCFNHLVTPLGTKIAYPIKDLCNILRYEEEKLTDVLLKLEQRRIVRSYKSNTDEVWYELYHDIFSEIIRRWNDEYKHSNSCFLHLCPLTKTIELFKGNINDNLSVNDFIIETGYHHDQIELDKRIDKDKQVANYQQFHLELISKFQVEQRIIEYWNAGEIEKALKLSEICINPNDMNRSAKVIKYLTTFRSSKSVGMLRNFANSKYENDDIRAECLLALILMGEKEPQYFNFLFEIIRKQIKSIGDVFTILDEEFTLELFIESLNIHYNNWITISKAFRLLMKNQYHNIVNKFGAIKKYELYFSESRIRSLVEKNGYIYINQAKEAYNHLKNKFDLYVVNDNRTRQVLDRLKDYYILFNKKVNNYKKPDPMHNYFQLALGSGRKKIRILKKYKKISSINELFNLIKSPPDKNKDIRIWAIYQLCFWGEYNDFVIKLLKNNDSDTSSMAAYALGEIGNISAINDLIASINQSDSQLKDIIINSLGRIGSPVILSLLSEILKNEQPLYVQLSTIKALGNTGSIEPLYSLIENQNDRISNNRFFISNALGKIRSAECVVPLIRLLDDVDYKVRLSAINSLGEIGSIEAIEPLLELKKRENYNELKAICLALGEINYPEALFALKEMLSEEWYVKESALLGLLKRKDNDRIKDILINMLSDTTWTVRYYVILLIGKLKNINKAEIIKNIYLDKKQNTDIKMAAGATLLKFDDDTAIKFLEKQRASEHTDVRKKLADILGIVPSIKGIQLLKELLTDENIEVKNQAIESLKKIDDPKLMENLMEIYRTLEEPEETKLNINLAVLHAIKIIADPKSAKQLTKIVLDEKTHIRIRNKAIDALGEIGKKDEKTVNILVDLLNKQETTFYCRIIKIIGKTRSAKAIPALYSHLNNLEQKKAEWRNKLS